MITKCSECQKEKSQAEFDKVFEATSQETICQDCTENYTLAQDGLFYHFDDAGAELAYSEWTPEVKAKADAYASILGRGWPIVTE